jgi:hypothetical protein
MSAAAAAEIANKLAINDDATSFPIGMVSSSERRRRLAPNARFIFVLLLLAKFGRFG